MPAKKLRHPPAHRQAPEFADVRPQKTMVHRDLDDLDDLAGTWVKDRAFDRAMAEMDKVDPKLWR